MKKDGEPGKKKDTKILTSYPFGKVIKRAIFVLKKKGGTKKKRFMVFYFWCAFKSSFGVA